MLYVISSKHDSKSHLIEWVAEKQVTQKNFLMVSYVKGYFVDNFYVIQFLNNEEDVYLSITT